MDEEIALREITVARGSFFPALTAPITYYGNTPSPAHEPGTPLIASFAPSNGINKTSAFLSAGGAIDVSGQLHAALTRSRLLLAAAHQGTEEARRALVIATTDAYYGLSLARQKRRLADETLALAEAFSQITSDLVRDGKSEQSDLSRARAEALRRRDELEQARAAESAASDLLHAITGIDPLIHVGVVRPTTDVPPMGNLGDETANVIASRPQLLQLQSQQQAVLSDIRIARAERMPQLAYNVAAGFDATDLHDIHRFTGGAAFVGLTLPLFNFGIARAHEAEATLRQESLKTQRDLLLRSLSQEFYSTRAAALGAVERMRVSQERAADAEKNLYDLLTRYRSHDANITQLLDAQSAHTDARTALYQAVTDYEAARVRLAIDPAAISYQPATLPRVATIDRCTDSVPPVIAGIRFGTTLDDLRRDHSSIAIPAADEHGVVTVEATPAMINAPRSDDPAFDVMHVTMKYQHDRLTNLRVLFSADTSWATKDAFLTAAAERFSLHGPWRAFYDWSNRTLEDDEDIRELAAECTGYRIRLGLGYFSEGVKRVATPHIKIDATP
ncbi:MAG TPA: TolC family protein [Thermoanaerobaculia bacterium]